MCSEDGVEAKCKEYRWTLKSEKGKKTDYPLITSKSNYSYWHLYFRPVKVISDFWIPEM